MNLIRDDASVAVFRFPFLKKLNFQDSDPYKNSFLAIFSKAMILEVLQNYIDEALKSKTNIMLSKIIDFMNQNELYFSKEIMILNLESLLKNKCNEEVNTLTRMIRRM